MNVAERFLAHPPDRVALVAGVDSLDYRQLEDRLARLRGGLVGAGIGVGDRVVLVSGNDELFVSAYAAVLGVGAVAVPLNPACPPAELRRELDVIEASAVIVGPAGAASWAALTEMEADADSIPRTLVYAQLLEAEPAPIAPVDDDDPAVFLFTSGTAGMPRPAVLTHGNIDASLRSMMTLPLELLTTPQVALAVIPLFHVFGLNIIVNLGLAIGATLVVEDFTTTGRLAELVEANEVTMLGGPPTMWRALANDGALGPEQFASLTLALSGAAKLPPPVAAAVSQALDVDVREGYGLTETCAIVATAAASSAPVGSVGLLVPGIEARLVDPGDVDVLVGDPGELWVRGPMVSAGYYNDVVAGARSRTADGWLRTGDVAVVDDAGHLAIVDRLKDTVIVSGFNVYPGEVEAILVSHPDVAEAGVVGEPDEATGERLVAFVVAAPGRTIDLDDLLAHCRTELARYKVPKNVEIRDGLPLGLAGKLRRRDLR